MKRIAVLLVLMIMTASVMAAMPDPPQVNAPAAYNSKVYLSWAADSAEYDSYHIYRSTYDVYSLRAETQSASYMDTGLFNGQTYNYLISGVKAAVESNTSVTLTAVPYSPPYRPNAVSITAQSGLNVSFTWSVSLTAGTYPLSSYKIKRATYQSGPDVGSVTYTSYADTVPQAGTRYYYSVVSVDSQLHESEPALFSCYVPGAPPAPQSLTITSYNAVSASLSWATPDASAQVTGYNVYRDDSLLGSTTLPSYTDNSGEIGGAYKYEVSAVNAFSESQLSSAVYVTLTASAPAMLSVSSGAQVGTLAVSWQALNAAELVSYYELFRSTGPSSFDLGTPLSVTNTVNYTDASAVTGTVYYYCVRAMTQTAMARLSQQASYLNVTLAPEVTGAAAIKNYGSVKITFTAADSSYGVTGYRIYRSTEPANYTLRMTVTSAEATDTGLNTYTAYYYGVSAVNYYSESTMTAGITAAADGDVEAPHSLTASAEADGTIKLSWAASSSSGVSSYKVYRTTTAGNYGQAFAQGVTVTVWYDSQALTSNTYCYSVSAMSVTESARSAEVCMQSAVVPLPPVSVSGNAASGGVVLSWLQPDNNAVYKYNIYKSTSSAVYSQAAFTSVATGVTSTAYFDQSVIQGRDYYYEVKTVLNNIQDMSTATTFVSVPLLSGPPLQVVAVPGDTQVILIWQIFVTNLPDYYAVYRRKSTDTQFGPSVFSYFNYDEKEIVDTNLENGTTYVYAVAAVNDTGEGPKSKEISVTPYKAIALPSDASLKGKVINKKDIAIDWNAATNGTYALSNYMLMRSQDRGYQYKVITVTAADAVSYIDEQTEWGSHYTYMLRAVDSAGHTDTAYNLLDMELELPGNKIKVYSNIVDMTKNETLKMRWFSVKPGKLKLSLFTLSGVFVKTLLETTVPPDVSKTNPYESEDVIWDMKNASGVKVASGVFLIMLESGNERVIAKVAVVK